MFCTDFWFWIQPSVGWFFWLTLTIVTSFCSQQVIQCSSIKIFNLNNSSIKIWSVIKVFPSFLYVRGVNLHWPQDSITNQLLTDVHPQFKAWEQHHSVILLFSCGLINNQHILQNLDYALSLYQCRIPSPHCDASYNQDIFTPLVYTFVHKALVALSGDQKDEPIPKDEPSCSRRVHRGIHQSQ